MTAQTAASAAYIVAALLFILALAGLSRHETARFGNTFGIAGMAIALVATLVLAIAGGFTGLQVGLLIGAVLIGAAVGLYRAARRADDRHARADRAVPQLRRPRRGAGRLERLPRGRSRSGGGRASLEPSLLGIHHAEVVIGVFIGAVTFTGSIVALGQAVGAVQVRARWCCPARTSSTSARWSRSPRSRCGSSSPPPSAC